MLVLLLLAVWLGSSLGLGPTFYGARTGKLINPSPESLRQARRLWEKHLLASDSGSSPLSDSSACDLAFTSLAQSLQSEYRALMTVSTYPAVLALPPDQLRNCFAAWATRLQDEKAARALVARTPRVLSRDPSAVASADENAVLLTLVFSHATAIGRELLHRLRRK